ncbi:MAG: hypothetical protein ABIB71_06820 [Candidatus Woesearchaeota archaeon]
MSAENAIAEMCKSLSKEFGKEIKAFFLVSKELVILVNREKKKEEVRGRAFGLKRKVEKVLGYELEISSYSSEEYFSKLMASDIKLFNEVRKAKILHDPDNFVALLKGIISSGRLIGTQASARELLDTVRKRQRKVHNLKLRALVKIYRAVVDAGEAALIARGYSVPSHDDVPKVLKDRFVRKNILEKKYVKICKAIMQEFRGFEHGSLRHISASGLDKMREDAEEFVERMRTIVR